MKVYLIKEEDFEKLLLMIDRDPTHGYEGGSSNSMNEQERRVYDEAHRFYNYQVRTWIDEVKK